MSLFSAWLTGHRGSWWMGYTYFLCSPNQIKKSYSSDFDSVIYQSSSILLQNGTPIVNCYYHLTLQTDTNVANHWQLTLLSPLRPCLIQHEIKSPIVTAHNTNTSKELPSRKLWDAYQKLAYGQTSLFRRLKETNKQESKEMIK